MLQLLPSSGYRQKLGVVPTKSTVRMHRALYKWPDGLERDSHIKLIIPTEGQPDRQLLNEGVGWLLAKLCELPVPPHAGYMLLPSELIIQAHPEVTCAIPEVPVWISSTEPNSGLSLTGTDLVTAVVDELSRWDHLPGTLAFDEWVANTDRNVTNLIRRGPGDFVLIDHDYCFTGPHWDAPAIHRGRQADYYNKLFDAVESVFGRSSETCSALKNAMVVPSEAFPDKLKSCADHLTGWFNLLMDSSVERWSLASFLSYRSRNLPDAIKRRYQLLT